MTNGVEPLTEAGRHWAEQLGRWAIPDDIVAQAEVPPWAHDPKTFAVDDTLDPSSPIFELARELLPPNGGSVIDIGCGGGRSSIPLAPRATHITGVDESAAMLERFATAAEAAGVRHHQLRGRWPDVYIEAEMRGEPLPTADVAVCHHVLFNVPDIEPFLVTLTAAARLGVVVVMPKKHPLSAWNEGWVHFWDLKRPDGPTSDDAVAVLRALGISPEVVVVPRPALSRHAEDPAELVESARRRLCLPKVREAEIEAWLRDHPPAFMREVVVLRWPGGLS
jgi:SAM-dependent methyltransferase